MPQTASSVEHGAEVATVGGELVEHGRRWCRYTGSLDDPVGLEVAQASGEHVGADARQALDQVGVTARTEQQLSHHEQRPAVTDHIEGPRHPAELAVRLHADR